MTPTLQRILFVVAALLLLVLPVFLNAAVLEYNHRDYAPGHVGALNRGATPVPTPTPVQVIDTAQEPAQELRSGPVVVDLAHGNRLNRAAFEPLAAALAERGVGMQFWLTEVDLLSLNNYYDFPDQSAELRPLLDDAAALVVVSPFFLWSPQEIALVERFVARGGRLLLISDPDILGDLAQDINNLAEPFGVVFHDDYLYNTVNNDGNFVHIFQEQFLNRAAHLTGSEIALYGARSLGGDVEPLVRTGPNVLSSLRTGAIQFDTVAIGGVAARGTEGRVLAMTDFDVLTQAYVVRHDNAYLLEFVADFLANGEMRRDVVDFPAFLGKDVTLVFGAGSDENGANGAVDAATLLQGARLQQQLETTGRSLTLAGAGALTRTLESALGETTAPEVTAPEAGSTLTQETDPEAAQETNARDWLVLADFKLADQTPLLADLGFSLVEVTPTPTPTPDPADAPNGDETDTDVTEPDDSDADESDAVETDEDPESPAEESPSDNGNDEDEETENGSGENGTNENGNDESDAGEAESRAARITAGITVGIAVSTESAQADPTPEPEEEPDSEPGDPTPTPEADDDEPTDEPQDPVTPTATVTPTVESAVEITPAVTTTATPTLTSTVTLTVTPEPETDEPEVTVYLVRDDGLRLLASQTVLIAQRELPDGERLVTVLGFDSTGIGAGVDRLLARNYEGCITGDALVVCSYADGREAPTPAAPAATPHPAAPAPTPDNGPPPTEPTPVTPPAPSPEPPDAPVSRILIVDDDANALEDESSESDIYLQTLVAQGLEPDLWSTNNQGVPTVRELLDYSWVVWSAGGYEGGGPSLPALDSLLGYINEGGRLTISSRQPFFGMGTEDASVIVDVQVDDDIPAMINGLPSEPFAIQPDTPPVVPLEINARENGPSVSLRRGPQSGSPDAPLLFMVDDASEEDATGARLMIFGMSLIWFTDGHERTLVTNMARVMLDD